MLLMSVYTCNCGRVGHKGTSGLVTNVVVVVLFTLVIVKMLAVVVLQGK